MANIELIQSSVRQQVAANTAGMFGRLRDHITRQVVYHMTRAELNRLNDRELADLGMSREGITGVARKAVWGVE